MDVTCLHNLLSPRPETKRRALARLGALFILQGRKQQPRLSPAMQRRLALHEREIGRGQPSQQYQVNGGGTTEIRMPSKR